MKKTFDLCVKVGSYQGKDGKEKGRYETIGSIVEGDKGTFMFLKRTFNPAGINSDKESIIVSMFAVDGKSKDHYAKQPVDVSFEMSNPFDDDQVPI